MVVHYTADVCRRPTLKIVAKLTSFSAKPEQINSCALRSSINPMDELLSFSSYDPDFGGIVIPYQPTSPPPILYHYTDAAGLKGIVESKSLWATHSRYTNDAAEVSYGIELATKLLESHVAESTRSEKKYTIEKLLSGDVPNVEPSDVLIEVALATLKTPAIEERSRYHFFFVCFSEEEDQLSQWRAYAGNASGFAVGFSRSILLNKSIKAQLQQDDLGDTIDLLKVIYEEEQQVSLCGALIQCARESIDQRVSQFSHDKRRQVLESSNLWLISALLRMSLFFKHPGFREEEEWRLVVCRSKVETAEKPTDYPVKTRTTSFGITPYVELPLCESDELLHLEHVVVGPRCEIAATSSSSIVGLEVLFQELAGGKPKRGIDRSRIPYR